MRLGEVMPSPLGFGESHEMTPSRLPAYAWAAPASLFGLVLAMLALRHGQIRLRAGIVEAHGRAIAWLLRTATLVPGGAAALTLGHVVVATSAEALEATRAHERVHVRQYERWGPFFVPAYLLASAWALARGRHVYFDNPFEREAFASARSMPRGVERRSPKRATEAQRHRAGA